MRFMPIDFVRLGLPLAAAIAAVVVARYYIAPGVDLEGMTRGIAGPGTWPKTMLYGTAVCAALIFLRQLFAPSRADTLTTKSAEPEFDDVRLALGVVLIVGYGFLIGFAGMAWATLAFIAGWLLLGGLRGPVKIVLVSTLGTVAILYLFVKVSLMPLDRGRGVFEQATIFLYRILGIY